MGNSPEELMLRLTMILLLGVGGQWVASWLRIPSIVVMLALGILAGPVTGFIQPDAVLGDLLSPLVSAAVSLILFDGSLGLKFSELKTISKALRNFLTIGMLITWVVCAAGARWILGLPMRESILLGAILVVTGPTVIGPMLRQIRPVGLAGNVAKWEGIVIDPIGASAAVLVFESFQSVQSATLNIIPYTVAGGVVRTLLAGSVLGIGSALGLVFLLRRHLIPDHLLSPVILMFVVGMSTLSNMIQHESGLLTVTLMGITLVNLIPELIKPIQHFKENLGTLLIACLFITLAARLDLDAFSSLGWRGGLFLALVIFVARPLAVFASSAGSNLTLADKVFLSWFAPRGIVAAAVSSVFALRLGAEAGVLVPVTFMVIIGTVVLYGLTAYPLAIRLGIASANPQGLLLGGANALARAIANGVQSVGMPVTLVDSSIDNVRASRKSGLNVYHANILSDEIDREVDFGGIGRFLALTANDEVNSLAAMHFSEMFGRKSVYQLSPETSGREKFDTSRYLIKGRFLFVPETPLRKLIAMIESGYVVRPIPISQEFTFDDFLKTHGTDTVLLFVVREKKYLDVISPGEVLNVRAGQTVIALVKDA